MFQTLGIRAEQNGIMPQPWDVGPDAAHRALMRNLRSDGKRSRSQSKYKQMNAKAHSFIPHIVTEHCAECWGPGP